MSGAVRWLLFFSVIVLAVAAIAAMWNGVTEELLKGVASFAVVALASVALYALSRRA